MELVADVIYHQSPHAHVKGAVASHLRYYGGIRMARPAIVGLDAELFPHLGPNLRNIFAQQLPREVK